SETAFIAIPRTRLLHLIQTGHSRANLVSRLLQRPERLLATILLSNNLVNTAAAALGTAVALSLIQHETLAVLISTVGVTVMLLIFSETLPKTIAWHRAEQVALAWARPLALVQLLLAPAIRVLQEITTLFTKLLRVTPADSTVREEEIRTLIAVGAQTGGLEASEALLLEKVFRFGDRQIRDVLTPRTEMVMIQQGTTLEEFLAVYNDHSHYRYPVYAGTIENVIGVLSVRDVLLGQASGEVGPRSSVTDLLHPAYFVPETNRVSSAFNEMRQSGQMLAIAVDEFGGIAGVATLQQLLGVIVGDIDDDGSPEDQDYTFIDANTTQVDGSLSIPDINDELGVGLPEGNYQTIAGFFLEQTGRIPSVGESLTFHDFRLTVIEMDGVRIKVMELKKES
ncbi:MAG: hemolysin family protein, partial [Dehalococcoidia bacterium]